MTVLQILNKVIAGNSIIADDGNDNELFSAGGQLTKTKS
jgi:hypothetical protein